MNEKEVKVIYIDPHFQEALREQKIKDALEGKENFYQVAKRISEEVGAKQIKQDELIAFKM